MAKRKKNKDQGPVTPKITPPPMGPGGENKNEDKFNFWSSRVNRSKRLRKNWEEKYKVTKCENFMLGLQTEDKNPNDPVFNHFLSTIKTIKPNIYFSNPKFFIRSKPGNAKPIEDDKSRMAEGLLDAIARQNNTLKNSGSLAIWQIFPRIAVIKAVYDPVMEPNPRKGEPIYRTYEDGSPVRDPNTKELIPITDPFTGDMVMEPDELVTDEAYRWEWVDAAMMLLPDEGPAQDRWSWVGEEVVVPLDEAREDKRFRKKVRDKLVANEVRELDRDPANVGQDMGDGIDDPESQMFRYYMIYDMKKKREIAFADGQEEKEFLMDRPLSEGIEDNPYSILAGFIPITGPKPSPWPVPLVYNWLPIQEEYNIRRKQITEGAKRSARKQFYDNSTFENEDEAVAALQSNMDMQGVKVRSIKNIPQTTQDPPINNTILQDIPLLQNDWRLISGQPGSRLSDPDSDTATEATIVERAANLKDNDMLSAVNDWLAMAGRKMFQLVKKTLTMDMYVKIRGLSDAEFKRYVQRVYGVSEEVTEFLPGLKELFRERFGKDKWLPVSREDLKFEADVEVVPGSFRPRNLAFERKEWLEFLSLIGQFPQLALSRELLRETASKFEHISERMLDELTALAQKMVQINANQAGRNQNGGQPPGAGNPVQQAFAGMSGGVG